MKWDRGWQDKLLAIRRDASTPIQNHAQKAGNPNLTGHGTLQQMWDRVLPGKRRAGGARYHERHNNPGLHL